MPHLLVQQVRFQFRRQISLISAEGQDIVGCPYYFPASSRTAAANARISSLYSPNIGSFM